MRRDAFYAALGERFDILDGATMKWRRSYIEQELRPLWNKIGLRVRDHWRAYYPRAKAETHVLAHLVARVLQEIANQLGDDDRALAAVKAAVDGNVAPGSAEERTLEEILGEWGDAIMVALFASVREAVHDLPPQPI